MVEFDVRIERFRDKETGQLVSGRMFKNIGHAAASIAKSAKASIKTSATPSRPGTPPHTRRGLIKRAIRYEANRQAKSAMIGPIASLIDDAAKVMEFGGRRGKQTYPARPFMGPALERNLHRLPSQFAGRVGG